MSFSRMKPLPKFILIAGGLALIFIGGRYAIGLMPKSEPAPTPVVATPVPAEKSEAGQAAIAATPTPAPVAPPPAVVAAPATDSPPAGLTQHGSTDAGLANILGTKK